MKKKFKVKRKVKIKKTLYLFLILLLLLFFNSKIDRIKSSKSRKELITSFLSTSNIYPQDKNLLTSFYEYINSYFYNNPITILENELKYSKANKTVSTINYKNDNPEVYIYNSHQGEKYSYKYLEQYNIVPDVLMASSMLEEKLEKRRINTLVEKNDILKYMNVHDLDHGDSYIASRHFLESVINRYDSFKLFIDLHRDAASHDVTTSTINGLNYAKIMFVIGLENSTYNKNLEVVTDLNNKILMKYPELTRGIMKKEGYGVNGVYNQDLNSNVILIEVGGNENNIEEINNTLDIISEIIGEYLNEKK